MWYMLTFPFYFLRLWQCIPVGNPPWHGYRHLGCSCYFAHRWPWHESQVVEDKAIKMAGQWEVHWFLIHNCFWRDIGDVVYFLMLVCFETRCISIGDSSPLPNLASKLLFSRESWINCTLCSPVPFSELMVPCSPFSYTKTAPPPRQLTENHLLIPVSYFYLFCPGISPLILAVFKTCE